MLAHSSWPLRNHQLEGSSSSRQEALGAQNAGEKNVKLFYRMFVRILSVKNDMTTETDLIDFKHVHHLTDFWVDICDQGSKASI